jgi:hypothetical protein
MASRKKCPYCSGDSEKIRGRVALNPSHLAFGAGERAYQCKSCGKKWIACYPIPPKGHSTGMSEPNKAMLRLSFIEGVRGYASPYVLRADAPVPEFFTLEPSLPESEPPESDTNQALSSDDSGKEGEA